MAYSKPRIKKGTLALIIALLLTTFLLNACGGDSRMQKQAEQNRKSFEQELTHARAIGVPESLLQPLIKQAQQLDRTSAPLTLFDNRPVIDYYNNLSQRYAMLTAQLRSTEAQAIQQLRLQASTNLHNFVRILAQRQAQGFATTKKFAHQLVHDQNLMAQAHYPRQYIQISTDARNATLALRLMGPTYDTLASFRNAIQQLSTSLIDATAFKQQELYDVEQFRKASSPNDFTHLIDQINSQLQTVSVLSIQALPYVASVRLQQISAAIDQMGLYGLDTGKYQAQLNADTVALHSARTLSDYLNVSALINTHLNAIQISLIRGKANYLLKQFHQEVAGWSSTHQYHDAYDGQSYELAYEYDQQGIGSDLDAAVQAARTQDDYQAAISLINNSMVHLKAMEADFGDSTPWNQPHAADMQLMQHYNATNGQVIVVSLLEQSLRLYQNGKLVHAFLITTGQYEKPSPPGYWHIFLRQSPTKFKSNEPKGSAFWYPDTNINYAMEYHDGGYYIHDSWWRQDYGPQTNFPHSDSGGNQEFAGNGSHGCINMQENDAAWLYANTDYGTSLIIY